jgi:Fasciclin domain
MKKTYNSQRAFYLVVLTGLVFITASCNKDLEQLPAIVKPAYPTGTTIGAAIAGNPNDSLFNRLIIRSGVNSALFNDSTKTFTLFVPDNNGMKVFINAASGGLVPLAAPDSVFSNFISRNLRAGQCDTLIRYVTVGQKYLAASLGTSFPNFPLTTQIILDPNQPFVRMPIFPVRGTPYSYVNSIPITGVDQIVSNGVIHHTAVLVTPPSAVLKTMIAGEATLKYFRAAVARADVGSTGLSRLDSLLNYGVTNMTVLTPNDAAMQPVLKGVLTLGYIQAGLSPFSADSLAALKSSVDSLASPTAGFNIVPVANVRGIVAYHFLATNSTGSYTPNIRVFSVNVPATPSFVTTLVNGSFATHPGVRALATFGASPIPTAVTFTGLGTFPSGGAPFSSPAANVVTKDKHAVNGVYHIIDRVLLPQ